MTDNERERIRLVEVDYASTTDFIKSVVTTATTIRGLAVTIWLALIGFSIQQGIWELAALAGVIAAVFLLLDGYHGWLYAEAEVHARAAERVTSRYYKALSKGEDEEDALLDFRAALRSYGFGLFLNIRAFRPRDLLLARPLLLYQLLYPLLIAFAALAAAGIAGGVIGGGTSEAGATPVRAIVLHTGAGHGGAGHGGTGHKQVALTLLVGPNTYISIAPAFNVNGLTLNLPGKGSTNEILRGPRGPCGKNGSRGAFGPRGYRGLRGLQGARGPRGSPGPRGLRGPAGANAPDGGS